MFKKLVSNLPFSPGLMNQVVFYAQRLRREKATRRLAVVFAALTLVVQMFTFIAPPEPSVAASSNDVICGGLRPGHEVQDLLAYYDSGNDWCGQTHIKDLFARFGIQRHHLQNTVLDTINSSAHDFWSIGRNPHSSQDVPFDVGFGLTKRFYGRPLRSWGHNVNYRVLVGNNGFVTFHVLIDCGNLTFIGPPPIPPPPPPPPPPPTPQASFDCTALQLLSLNKTEAAVGVSATDITTAEFRANGTAHNASIQAYLLDFGDGTSQTIASSATNVTVKHDYKKAGTYTAKLRVQTSAGVTGNKPICQQTFTIGDLKPQKQVINTSRPQSDPAAVNADQTTAKAGETLEYAISLRNSGQQTVNDRVFEENLRDILEYADLADAGGGQLEDGILTWPALDIKPDETVTKRFQVKIKQPVPATPTSRSDPQSFDLCMDNVFEGQEARVCINIPPPPKVIEGVAQELPNTGPGLNIMLGSLFIAALSFFFLRNRQLIKEIAILRKEYNQG